MGASDQSLGHRGVAPLEGDRAVMPLVFEEATWKAKLPNNKRPLHCNVAHM